MDESEREIYRANVQSLFKIKQVILEKTQLNSDQIVVDKNSKRVLIVEGSDLRLTATMISRTNIQ